MERIAKFSLVSEKRWIRDWCSTFEGTDVPASEEAAREIYGRLRLPGRATAGSAGYDFHTPLAFTLGPGESIKIPTGVRVEMSEGWVLFIMPRSSLGFKYKLELNNKEFNLLKYLMQKEGKALTRENILNAVWGYDEGETRTVDNHVARLRKLGIDYIETVFGVGYKFVYRE